MIPRKAFWEGRLALGLVSLPVRLYPAAESKQVRFHFLHHKCLTPLEYERYCPHCRIDVRWEEVARGFEFEKGKFVPLSAEDFARLPLKTARTIEILSFVDAREVDSLFFEKSYWVVPHSAGLEAYRLLAEALTRLGKFALAKVVIRHKEHLALLRPLEGALVLVTLHYSDEIHKPSEFPELRKEAKPSPEELELALELLRSLSSSFSPEHHHDEYRRKLLELLKAKAEGRELLPLVQEKLKQPLELVEALRASLLLAKRKHRKK